MALPCFYFNVMDTLFFTNIDEYYTKLLFFLQRTLNITMNIKELQLLNEFDQEVISSQDFHIEFV